MKLANATKLNRKSGGADLRCASQSSNSAAFKASPFAVAFRKGALQVPRLPPDFLSGLVASVTLMRLSSKKAAYVVVVEICVVGNPEFARDDKRGGQRSPKQLLSGMERAVRRARSERSFHPHHKL